MLSRLLSTAAALLLCASASAQIYHCEQDGARVFSDRPCGDDARTYEPSAAVSYVVPDETLPDLAESARRFIAERRSRLARQRSFPANDRPSPAGAAPKAFTSPWLYLRGAGRPVHRQASAESVARPQPQRYSALHGPILGTRGTEPYRVRLSAGPEPERRP